MLLLSFHGTGQKHIGKKRFNGRGIQAPGMEQHLHGINNRIAEREVLFLRSANGVFLAGIADADGRVVCGPGYERSCDSIIVYDDDELKFHIPGSQCLSSDSGDSFDELCHHYRRENANVDTLPE